MKPQRATFTLPPLRRFKLWAGVYGGHYDIIVLFKRKPTHTEEMMRPFGRGETMRVIDCLAEADAGNIVADMGLCAFQERFPGLDLSSILGLNGRPRAIEIPADDLLRLELDMPCEDGRVESINLHQDWR